MHVVFVVPRFYPYRGGYENSLLALGRYLVEHGHRATVFTTVADDLEAFWLGGFKTFPEGPFSLDGISVRRFPISYDVLRRRATRLLGLVPYWRWKAQFWRPSFPVAGIAEALRAIDADLLHIGPLPYNSLMYAGLHAGELRNCPVVATPCAHLGEPGSNAVSQHYLQPHQLALLRACQKVFCMTPTESDHLRNLGIPEQRLAVAPFGFDWQVAVGGDPEFLQKKYGVDGPVVLHLGMKAHEKGSETLVEAMKLLWDRGSNAWLVMAGPELSSFASYLASNGAGCPKLLNLPPFAEGEKRDLLAAATVVAQPSRVESLGLVLLEAWANRKPVIAADIEVSRELVGGSGGGTIVPFGDAQRLASALETMLSQPAARESMGAAGYEMAMPYRGEAVWQKITAEFEEVVASHGRQKP